MHAFLNKRAQKGMANGEQAGSRVNKRAHLEAQFREQARGKRVKGQKELVEG